MVTVIWAVFIIAAVAASFFGTVNSGNFRDYFKKSYPKEWEEYIKSKPRFYIPGKMEGTWSTNTGTIWQFIQKTPSLSKDLRLKELHERDRKTRIIIGCGAIIFFALLLWSRFW